ncbi:MAG: nicotinate phosphoribosyltransferase [Chloroflexota bacterium]|nr:nicotinate phosphoribosyltransferase [Chloroflexota bacterium]
MTADATRAGGRGQLPDPRFAPAADVLSGETADVYFARARAILDAEHLDPIVTMEIFPRAEGVLCGAAEALAYLREVLRPESDGSDPAVVESLADGDPFWRNEVVMRITARYSRFGLYETAILGILAQSSGWATAARAVVAAAAPTPVIGFGARHVHPSVSDQMDYASVVGGCVGASTPAGARLAGLAPTGTMPHALILIFGDTVRAAEAFDRWIDPDVPRIVLVDTFKDEAEESLRVAEALGERLWGVRLDTPSERGRVTAELVKEVRARLDQAGHEHVRIVVSGGLDVDRIAYFKERGAPVDSYAVGSAISDASPIDFTGDLKEVDGRPIAKRGRIPGRTDNPRLQPVDLTAGVR